MAIAAKNQLSNVNRKGSALLIVLFVVMAVTILSLGFLSRSDVELACGQNMMLRTEMDYLAESGLEHAKGLILNPQDVSSEYWTGATAQQLIGGSDDYYDLEVARDDSDPMDRCNYNIDCNSYRLKGGEKIGRSNLSTQLRIDPCIALWTGNNATIWSNFVVHGDVYCNGKLINIGLINGDVFVNSLSGILPTGQQKVTADLSLDWPNITVDDFKSRSGVSYYSSNHNLTGNIHIDGILLVDGNLTVQSASDVNIVVYKNLPALYVTGDLEIESGARLDINGLAVVDGNVHISADSASLNVLGGIFIKGVLVETTVDASGNDHNGILYNGPTWSFVDDHSALSFDGIDDIVEDPEAGSYLNGLAAITVSLWVKSDVTFQDRGILFTREPTGNDEELGIRYDKTGAFGGGVRCIKASISTDLGYTQIESSSNVQTTAWQHLVLVWESGSSLKLYINGQHNPLSYDRTPSGLSGTIGGIQKLMLGRGTKGKYWDGLFDDLRIYNQALDANDVSLIYNSLPDPNNTPMAHWKLDEPGSNVTIIAAPAKTAIWIWSEEGPQERWGQAVGAFFRSIKRK